MVKKKTEKDEPKFVIKKRAPKEKPNFFQNLTPFKHPVTEIFEQAKLIPATPDEATPVQPIQPDLSYPILANDSPSNPILAHTTPYKPVSAEKDYQKVPNSISRDAIPLKFFKGTSKNTYDALFLRTRGAIKPSRTIKATKKELMKWIGISHVTIFKHLTHLESVGLISITHELGSHTGSIYEVFIPEEIEPVLPRTSPYNPDLSNDSPSNAIPSPNVVWDPSNKVVLDRMGKTTENKEGYETVKTSFKTNTSDDEAFAEFIEIFQDFSRKLHGKSFGKKDAQKWADVARVLVGELEQVKTGISSIPALLETHLTRAFKKGVPPSSAKTKTDKVGTARNDLQIQLEALRQTLAEEGSEAVLKWKDAFEPEDWQWLTARLDDQKRAEPDENPA